MFRVVAVVLCIWVVVGGVPADLLAVPSELHHQGRLLDAEGAPLEGSVAMTFRLFEDSTGGVSLWSETHPTVEVAGGLFSVSLGATTPLGADLLTSPPNSGLPPAVRYLEIEVGGEVISPRTRLLATPYAIATSRISGDVESSPNQLAVGDLDGDGIPDLLLVSDVTSARLAIKTKGTGANRTAITAESTGGESAEMRAEADADDDGNPEFSVQTLVTADSARHWLDTDSDDDGLSDASSNLQVTPSGASHTLLWNSTTGLARQRADVTVSEVVVTKELDSNRNGNPENSVSTLVTADSAVHRLDNDSDDDGLSDADAELGVIPGVAWMAIKTKGTGADKNRVVGSANDTSAVLVCDNDSDDDGLSDTDAELGVIPGTAWVAIKTKGTGADKNRVIGTTDDTSAVVIAESDSASIAMRTKGGGVIKGAININHASRSLVDLSVGDSASTISSAVDLDGDGLPDVAMVEACTVDSVFREITYSYPDAATPQVLMKAKERGNRTKCSNSLRQFRSSSDTETEVGVDSTSASTFWRANNFSGTITSITIQASIDPLVNPIEHSSGAILTPGGVWTNASDEDLKENFQPVDGDEILEKIEDLEITQWNYKVEGEEITHIGPTAQDFQAAFGLGGSDKTISTIDPAGVALAAIKALNEKSKRVEELEAKVEALTRLVEKLAQSKP